MLMLALLDTGANCNVISQRFKESLQVTDKHTKITFANKENSEIASLCNISFCIEHDDMTLNFQAEFFICNIAEDIILGNPFLKRTGVIYLCLNGAAANPFRPQLNHVEELFGDEDGEFETVTAAEGVAFDPDTINLWEQFAVKCGRILQRSRIFCFAHEVANRRVSKSYSGSSEIDGQYIGSYICSI